MVTWIPYAGSWPSMEGLSLYGGIIPSMGGWYPLWRDNTLYGGIIPSMEG